MKHINHEVGLCVVGGGLAGLCAAVSAARHGIKVVLMQDRPVLGGNASSEIRMHVCGAHGPNNRETGIVEELELENFYRNSSCSYTVWDSVLHGCAMSEENLTLLLNCTCQTAETDAESKRIKSITGWQLNTETYHTVKADFFADCSGDSILAPLTGAEHTMGREARSEFNESIAPEVADKKTMGMSCLFQIRETDSPQPYIPPKWAYVYETDDDLPQATHSIGTNYWWIELGGTEDCIHDSDKLRDELLKIAFGVWDHIKNRGDHGCENWELDWVGFLPGKRESRRYRGAHVVTQNDVEAGGKFEDTVAYAGWTMDDHFPEGFYYRGGHPTIYHPAPSPWGIPYRALYSANIPNLFFAGRNISVTHSALSSSRVMATCALIGQAVGTAAALAVNSGAADAKSVDIGELQAQLMWDDCFLPGIERKPSEITLSAKTSHPELKDGYDRTNAAELEIGETVSYEWDDAVDVDEMRIIFDSYLDREYNNMPCYYPLNQPKFKTPQSLVRSFTVEGFTASGEKVVLHSDDANYQRHIHFKVGQPLKSVSLTVHSTYGSEKASVFSMDVK